MHLISRILKTRRVTAATRQKQNAKKRFRLVSAEPMEPRCLLSVSPIQVGAVYIEQDVGNDAIGDTFLISFDGGAAGTQLDRVTISGDQVITGFGVGDVFFDIHPDGLGADRAFDFAITSASGIEDVQATVVDGGLSLVLDFNGFDAGEQLVFSIDVDEVEDFDPAESNLEFVNEGLDPITSGVEFQGSQLTAEFSAAHFYDVQQSTTFRNRYDDQLVASGLDLPEDNAGEQRDRTAGAFAQLQQAFIPATISGHVYHDRNDNGLRENGEEGLSQVAVELIPLATVDEQASVMVLTDATGYYEVTGLAAGSYRVAETLQPTGYLDGLDAAGTVNGTTVGVARNPGDEITDIVLAGGAVGLDYDFGEVLPSSIAGRVQLSTRDGDCFGEDVDHQPVAGATVQLFGGDGNLIAETKTDANGEYAFVGLRPDRYTVVELTPNGLFDGGANLGTIEGNAAGQRNTDGSITIDLTGGQHAEDVDFCEHAPATIEGRVYHDRINNGVRDPGDEGLDRVVLQLLDQEGQLVAETRTDDVGGYQFRGLKAGTYDIRELQPQGWLDGMDTAGLIQGARSGRPENPGDVIRGVDVGWGDEGVEFNFGEFLPSSIAGRVQLSTRDGDCFGETARHEGLPGVRVVLLDADGEQVAETFSDADGYYQFSGLLPGTYALVEETPAGLFDGGALPGDIDGARQGQAVDGNTITGIRLTSGDEAEDYVFCEHEPATIEGRVYHDRINNGVRDPGDGGLDRVVLQLLDQEGQLVAETRTDDVGGYKFRGLKAGTYDIRELQPQGWLDGIDTAGLIQGARSGRPENPGDVIRGVDVGWGDEGVEFNFGEFLPSSIAGRVQLSTRDGDCFGETARHEGLPGVRVVLLDADGEQVAETFSDAEGYYQFSGLLPGTYALVEETPAGLFDGGALPGDIDGARQGQAVDGNTITGIQLTSGDEADDYLFCEHQPAELDGKVYHDRNNNGSREAGEEGIAGVLIQLLDQDGNVVAETTTDHEGGYRFTDLPAGKYNIRQMQPTGWLDGTDSAGTVNGQPSGQPENPGDSIRGVELRWGDLGTGFDFGELQPGMLSGVVHTDLVRDCVFQLDDGESAIAGVRIQLLDADGQVVASTQTNQLGEYRFENLAPGEYSLRELQPEGYFDGGWHDGQDRGTGDRIVGLQLGSGQSIATLNFCEVPPGLISGYVFQDGDVITLEAEEQLPERLADVRDGQRSADDVALPGVTLQLRDGITGRPIDGSQALEGAHDAGPISTVSNQLGYYEFVGLRPGNYAVYQIQPDAFIDGIDTPGTTSGFVFNPGEPVNNAVLQSLQVDPQNNAIVRISLPPGTLSIENNFSEVLVRRLDPPPVPPPPKLPPGKLPEIPLRPLAEVALPVLVVPDLPRFEILSFGDGSESPVSNWHLSVINGGRPRGRGLTVREPNNVWMAAHQKVRGPTALRKGEWSLPRTYAQTKPGAGQILFGLEGAIPFAADFNGDGFDELGIFLQGEWFIDLNANGTWDAEDLWARLGDRDDLPVTGDWDGDGKADIGIFGRAWTGDAKAIVYEPGLPDSENATQGGEKNLPPRHDRATSGRRELQLSAKGRRRADIIDHVFHFGSPVDQPVVADWNGDGIASIGVFREGRWHVDVNGDGKWTDEDRIYRFGRSGDIALTGDFNGDGLDDLGVFREGWIYIDSNGNRTFDPGDTVRQIGAPGDHPVAGDWDGDGQDEIALYRGLGQDGSTDDATTDAAPPVRTALKDAG